MADFLMFRNFPNCFRVLPFIEALPCPYLLQDSLRDLFSTVSLLSWSREREREKYREPAENNKNIYIFRKEARV